MEPTIVLGAGGHAKVIIEVLRESGAYQPVGCLGQLPESCHDLLGVPVLGNDDQLDAIRARGIQYAFVAIGDNRVRHLLIERVRRAGFRLAQAISPRATISPSAQLGDGVVVMPGAHVGTETRLGDGVIVNTRAIVDHDGRLENCVHIGPGAALAGNVHVGELAFIATGSSVIPHMHIGARTIVGAGSVVVRDLPSDVVAYGSPARPQRTLTPASSATSSSSQLRMAS